MSLQSNGAIAVLLGAMVWGLFWYPMRYFDDAGVEGIWAIVIVMVSGGLLIGPIAVWRGEFKRDDLIGILSIGFVAALATILYFLGIIYSDVVRVIFLFYLLPIWAILIARFYLGQSIGAVRLVVVFIALLGLGLLLGGGQMILPIPQNLGDWFGVFSGFFWALGLTLIGQNPKIGSWANIASTFMIAALLGIILGLGSHVFGSMQFGKLPEFSVLAAIFPLAFLFALCFYIPSMLGQLWGARFISSPFAALLTMSEIIVASLSAYLIIGTELTLVAWCGGGVIILALLLDIYMQFRETRHERNLSRDR